MMTGVSEDDVETRLRGGIQPKTSPSCSFVVHVEEGPDRGRSLTLDARSPMRALVGVSHTCDLNLHDPEVSRRHLAIEIAGVQLRVTDLGSLNGTRVGGLRIVEALLEGGERVQLGATTLRIERQDRAAKAATSAAMRFGQVIGASAEMRRIYPICDKLAQSNVSVLIEGETGTGKEDLARALHEVGPRAKKPFIVFDCAAVPPSLVVEARKGVFERAHTGTLLIDEIGDLDIALQPKLLRAVERSEVQTLGGSRTIRVDVRLLAATRRDLDKEVESGRFRDDLFHRLAVARVELPPLRRRVGDVRLLAAYFCASMGGAADAIPARVMEAWEAWSWPGNVRELKNAVARQLALGDLAELHGRPHSAPAAEPSQDFFADVIAKGLPLAQARQLVVDAFDARYIKEVLDQHGGNVTRAAEASGVARRHLHRLLTRSTK
jgi:transcriptional regulator with GAF, ATPase, and Fis domain